MLELILASTSPYRRQLLERLGLPFSQIKPDSDEEALKDPTLNPEALARVLARAKAMSIASQHPDAVVIGSDQLADLDGRILGKGHTPQGAADQLRAMAGTSHRLITAVCLAHGDQVVEFTDITTLYMRPLSDAAIERYIGEDNPVDCAGSYKLESRGISLFERIETADHTAITGLPLIRLTNELLDLGFEIP